VSKATAPAELRGAAFRIARNAGSMLLGDAAGEVLNSYAMVLAALSLGPAGFGTLSEAQAFMDPFDSLAALGMANVAITVAAARGGCDGVLRGTVWRIRALAVLCTPLLAFAIALATGRSHLLPLLGVLALGMLAAPTTIVSSLPFFYEQRIHRRIVIPFLIGIVRVATAYLASIALNRPIGYQLSIMSAAFAGALLMRAWARRHYPDPLRFDRALALHLLHLGWPAAVLEFVVASYTRGSYFFLHSQGAHTLGEYAAAERLTRPASALAGAIFFSSLPTLAKLATAGEFRTMEAVYRRGVVRVLAGMSIIVTGAWFAGPRIIAAAAPDYSGAIVPFRILAIGSIFMFANQLSMTYMIALKRFRIVMSVAIVNLLVYVSLASALVPRYGARGAASATCSMEAFSMLVQLSVVWYLIRLEARRSKGERPAL
jgi:O-antigen/teichoic acid export membrane protein